MRGVAYFLLFSLMVVSLIFVSSNVFAAACNSSSTLDFCGTTISSSLGHGAVEICGDCYVCGADDGVCPEDFYNGSAYADCSNCPDPDCVRTLTGVVSDPYGNPLSGVDVSAQILTISDWASRYTALTDSSGTYSLSVPPGNYKVSFKKAGYDTRLVSAPPYRGGSWTLNVALQNGSCHSDCSGYHYEDDVPRCSAACDGLVINGDACDFFSNSTFPNIASVCDGVPVGAKKVLAVDGNVSIVVQCCEGTPYKEVRPPVSFVNNNIENLVTQTFVAEMDDQASLVKLKIVIYDK